MQTFDELWPALAPRLQAAIEAEFWPRLEEIHAEAPEKVQEKTVRLLDSDQLFFAAVWAAAQQVATLWPGELILLFDVDDSIGTADFLTPEEFVTRLRPALPFLIGLLLEEFGQRLRIGLITSRPRAFLLSQLTDERHLGLIGAVVNPNLVLTTDSKEGVYGEMDGVEMSNHILQNRQSILDPDLIAKELNTRLPLAWLSPEEFMKLELVWDVLRSYPSAAFVVIDNARYPTILHKGSPRIYGVQLEGASRFPRL